MGEPQHGYRRSEHAEQRKLEGRPISNAYVDAQNSRLNGVFLQPDGRYVVRAKRGREHIFEYSGELVTSIRRSERVHRNKVRRGERQPVTYEQFQHFKEMLS